MFLNAYQSSKSLDICFLAISSFLMSFFFLSIYNPKLLSSLQIRIKLNESGQTVAAGK